MLLTWALPPCQAEEALKSGLVDVVVGKPEDLLATAKALALDIANGVKPKVQALRKTDKLPNMMARLELGGGGESDRHVLTQDTQPQALNFILATVREETEKVCAAAHVCLCAPGSPRSSLCVPSTGVHVHEAPAGVHRRGGDGHHPRRRGGHQEGGRAVQGAWRWLLHTVLTPSHSPPPPHTHTQACVQNETSKSLVHMFFATRSTASVPGYTDRGLKPRKIARVGVLGGGLMGAGIAAACLFNGMEVLLKEVSQQFLDGGLARVKANVESMAKKKKMSPDAVAAILGRLRGTLDYSGFGALDMVIEAVLEDLKLKQQIFADLEKACSPTCILSTNTSTIDITKVAANTSCPDRVVGAHFFSPAHIMQLFEIVRTSKTSPQTVVDTLGFSKQIKKMPVVVGNCTGFAVNRVFFPYTMSACLAADLGMDPYRIDAVISKRFGMPMVRACDGDRAAPPAVTDLGPPSIHRAPSA